MIIFGHVIVWKNVKGVFPFQILFMVLFLTRNHLHFGCGYDVIKKICVKIRPILKVNIIYLLLMVLELKMKI